MGVNEDAFSRSDFPGRKVGWFNQRFDGVEVGDDDTGDGDDVMVFLVYSPDNNMAGYAALQVLNFTAAEATTL